MFLFVVCCMWGSFLLEWCVCVCVCVYVYVHVIVCVCVCVCCLFRYMESFDSLGEFVDLDLLDHLDGSMLMNKKLLFLGGCDGGWGGG